MALVNRHRLHRAVIRCKAKMRLLEAIDEQFDWDNPFDDSLLKDLAASLFQSKQYQGFFERYLSQEEAQGVEDELAQVLADTYQSFLKRQQDPIIKSLNALL